MRMQKTEIYHHILQKMKEFDREELSEPGFEDELWNHFNRLPARYATDVNIDGPEDVLMHMKLLQLAYESATKSAFEIRIVQVPLSDVSYSGTADSNFMLTVDPENSDCSTKPSQPTLAFGISPSLELALEATKSNGQVVGDGERRYFRTLYEITISTVDTPKLLSQLTSLLSEIGLNIQEAHAFSTTDGYSLDVFVVDSWSSEGTERLKDVLECKLPKIENISRTSSNKKFKSPAEVSEAMTKLAKLQLELDQAREREKAAKTKLSEITEEAYVKGYRGGFLEGLGLGYNMGLDAAKIPAEAELRAVPEVPVPDVQMPSEKISEQAIDVDS